MKPWAERSTVERAGLVGGIAAAVIAAIFGVTRLAAPPASGPAPEAATATGGGSDAPAAEVAAETPPTEPATEEAAASGTAGADAAATDTAEEAGAEAAETGTSAEESAETGPAESTDAAAAPGADAETAAEGTAAETAAAPASADPEAAAPADAAEVAPAEAAPVAPEFDLVRVARDGSTVVAGSAAPGASVKLLLDGAEIGAVPADAQGSFVALFNLAPSEAARVLTMVSVLPDGTQIASDGRIAISPTVAPARAVAATETSPADGTAEAPDAAPESEAPAALLVTDEGTRILQSAGELSPAMAANVTVDAITYTPEGAVQLAGRGTGGAVVRLYLDNAQVADTTVDGQGGWSLTLGDVAPGLYTLRADQIGPDGQVTSRFETPFQRETAEALAAAAAVGTADPSPTADGSSAATATEATAADAAPPAAAAPVSVTVQPGFTLWRIARENLGDGVLYVQVFEANKDQIRDPDLIYPGQVFAIPDGD